MANATQLEKSPPVLGQPTFANRMVAIWGLLKVRWAEMSARQRSWGITATLMLVGLVGGLLWLTLRTDWRTLYSGMDPDDARQMGTILTQAQIPFDVTADGTGIRVAASQLDKARLATAAKGGAKSGRLGFEIFDKPNWVGSEFDEQVNFQRALEGELEHTIGTLADVQSARVHLVLQKDSLFRDQERPAKASVVIQLRHLSLAEGEPDQIRNLVASAVDGLTPDHVVLVDASGHLPLGPKTAEAMELSAEQALEEKLITTLEPITGSGNVRASVTLDYNPAATEINQEIYDPSQAVPLTMQRTEQTTGGQPVAAGVPGAASNAPNSQAVPPVYPQQNTPPESAKSESGTYGVSKTVKHTLENPGGVKRLTAAIVVNDRLLQPASKNKAAVWQPRSADELQRLTALAEAAVGFDTTRGDIVTVQDIGFDGNRAETQPPLYEQLTAAAEGSPLLLKYGALFAGLIVVLAFGVRPALKGVSAAARSKELDKQGTKELTSGSPAAASTPLELAETDPERVRTQEIFEQVTSHLRREPTQSSRLLQSWIHSD